MSIRLSYVVCAVVLLLPAQASAEWQLKPFLGVTFGAGNTTLVDLEHAAGDPHLTLGVTGMLVGEIFGVEADLGHARRFFQSDGQPVPSGVIQLVSSGVTTFTGNFVAAMPRRIARYGLRPYAVIGMGVMHVSEEDLNNVVTFTTDLKTLDFGGGVTGFLSRRVGVNWDVRHFKSFGGEETSHSLGAEELSFWRASMALAIRL